MISYRYHLISIIGIFLALALGVVVGTTAVNGAVVGDLRRQVKDLKAANADAAARASSLSKDAGNADTLAQAFGASIVSGKLSNVGVVVVSLPGTTANLTNAVVTEIAAAGGKVTGKLQITKDFIDPGRVADIRSLATSGAHPVGLQLPETDDAGRLAGSLLGFVLLGKGAPTDLTQVIAGFTGLKMIKADGGLSAGRAVVLLSPGALAKTDGSAAMLTGFSTELGAKGPALVVGDSTSAAGGLINAVRANADAKDNVSTVDDGATPLGQVTMALSLAEVVAGRKGNYGTAANADALLPTAN